MAHCHDFEIITSCTARRFLPEPGIQTVYPGFNFLVAFTFKSVIKEIIFYLSVFYVFRHEGASVTQ